MVNLEDCVAVTQNYCGLDNFDEVWRRTRKEREKLADRWLRNMRRFAPELHRRAIQPNMEAKFQMRHERGEGDETPTQSSSSGSSSDSSTDEGEDLDLGRVTQPTTLTAPWLMKKEAGAPPAEPVVRMDLGEGAGPGGA